MNFEEMRYSILLVSSNEKFTENTLAILPDNKYRPVTVVNDVMGARRKLLDRRFDLIMINSPLTDDFGLRFALDAAETSGAGILLLMKAEHYEEITERVAPYGILTLSKPTNAMMITRSLALLCATRQRLRKMEEKTATLEEKMEEIRIVNRAKWILVEQLKMTEDEAHKYIEKQAMDRCVKRRKVAESIISMYK